MENKRRVLTRVTSYLLCSSLLWFLLYFQDKQSQRQWNLMQLGWTLLGGSTQISPPSPEVVAAWPVTEGEGDEGENEGREEKKGWEVKTRQDRSDEVVKLRDSRYLGVQSCDEMWRWYLGCEREVSLLCFIALKGWTHWKVTRVLWLGSDNRWELTIYKRGMFLRLQCHFEMQFKNFYLDWDLHKNRLKV